MNSYNALFHHHLLTLYHQKYIRVYPHQSKYPAPTRAHLTAFSFSPSNPFHRPTLNTRAKALLFSPHHVLHSYIYSHSSAQHTHITYIHTHSSERVHIYVLYKPTNNTRVRLLLFFLRFLPNLISHS